MRLIICFGCENKNGGNFTSFKSKNEGKSNQIKSNQFYLSSIAWGVVAQSPEPGAHVLNARAFRIELEFRNVGFCGEGKTGVPGEKPLGAEKRTNNKLNPHMTSSPGIEPGPHWWKASALTTVPSLLPQIIAKNMGRAARRQLEGRHLLFGEYLWSWTTLNVHYRRWT